MLAKQFVPVPFGQGLDTKSAGPAVQMGRLAELENGVFTKLGQITKRNGYDALGTTVYGSAEPIATAAGLTSFRDRELLLFSGERMYGYSDALSSWVDRGAAVSVLLTEQSVVRNSYEQSAADAAQASGLTCVAWEDSRGGVRCSVFDTETGTRFIDDEQVSANGVHVRVVVFLDSFWIWYAYGNNLFYRRVSVASPSMLATEQNPIATLEPSNKAYDVVVAESESRMFIAYASPSSVCGAWIDSELALAEASLLGSVVADSIAAAFDATAVEYHMLYSDGTALYAGSFEEGLAVQLADNLISSTANVERLAVFFDGTVDTAKYVAEVSALSSSNNYVVLGSYVASTGVPGTETTIARSVSLVARPFEYADAWYVPVAHDSTLQATHFVIDLTGRVIAKGTPGQAGGIRGNNTIATIASTTDGIFSFAGAVRGTLQSESGVLSAREGVGLTKLDFTSANRHAASEIAGNLLVAGGVLRAYDGVQIVEHGFHLYPEGSTASVGVGGGGLTNGETYQWRAIYEWTDARGQVHRSAPGQVTISGASSYTSASGSETVTLTIPTLRLTEKADVRIAVYRTEGNGSIFYRLSPVSTPTENDTTADTVTFVDTYADTAITSNELLYTTGSVLDHIAPSACSLVVTHKGRAFIAGLADSEKVAFSKAVVPGEAVAFNDALYITPDPQGGSVTALASVDDRLVIFKRNAIYAVFGEGPNNTGLLGEFSEPQLITSDVGCSEPRSVVVTSAGVMFKGAKGIYLLDRGGAVTYIGAPVEAWNDETVTSAVLVPNTNQVRFTTAAGPALVYDYVFNQWSTFTNHDAVDAATWDDRYVFVKSSGRAYIEDSTGHDDDGEHVKLKATTAWMQMGGIQGFQRVYKILFLGDYKGSHSLRVRIGYDYRPDFTFDETINVQSLIGPGTWGSDATWGSGAVWGGEYPLEQFEIHPDRQKCQALRVCLEDVQTSNYNEGLTMTALGFWAGVKPGPNRMRSTLKV